jgi:hypothetical protein
MQIYKILSYKLLVKLNFICFYYLKAEDAVYRTEFIKNL